MMKPVLIHLHVPKTAGTSVGQALQRHVGYDRVIGSDDQVKLKAFLALTAEERDARVDLTRGHWWRWGAHRLFKRPCVYVSTMRDPIARVCSMFNYIHTRPMNPMHQAFKDGLPSLDLLPTSPTELFHKALRPPYGHWYWIQPPTTDEEYARCEAHVLAQIRKGHLRTGTLDVVVSQLRMMGIVKRDLPRVHETQLAVCDDYEPASPTTLAPRTLSHLRQVHRYDIRLFAAVCAEQSKGSHQSR